MKRFFTIIICLLCITICYAQHYELSHAKNLIENEKYLEAAKILRPLADNGNAEAQYIAAGLFVQGKGVIKSEEQAEKYYLLAVNSRHKQAALDLISLYDKNKQYEKVIKLFATVKEHADAYQFTPKERNILNYHWGKYLYHGYGLPKADKIKGWGKMYQSGLHRESLNKLRNDFYSHLIEGESYDAIVTLCDDCWNTDKNGKGWSANFFDDFILKIKTLPFSEQTEIFDEIQHCQSEAEDKSAYAVLLTMMMAEGIGIKKNIDVAKKIYSNIINDETFHILYKSLYENCDTDKSGTNGCMKRADFPEFYKVVLADCNERKERWDFVSKRRNVKLYCGANMFEIKECTAYPTSEGVTICFDLYNKSPNGSGRTTYASNAYVRYNGKRLKAKVTFYKDSSVGLKGHSVTKFYVKVSDPLPESGEFESVNFELKTDFGTGTVRAEQVVWNNRLSHYH